MRPEEYGLTITAPGEAYPYVYDDPRIDHLKIAYDFEFETSTEIDPKLKQELYDIAAEWKRRHQSEQLPFLLFTKSMDFVKVYDDRSLQSTQIRLEGAAAKAFLFCNETPKTINQIKEHLKDHNIEGEESAEEAIRFLENKGLVYGERGKYFNLALPHNSNL